MVKNVLTTPVFDKNFEAYHKNVPIICNEGGSRSSKTFSVIQLLIGIALSETGKRISVVSHSLPHVRRGVLRDFETLMKETIGIWSKDRWSATNFIYTFDNDSYIEFFGLEDETKARGPGRDLLFINEANLVSKYLFDQLAMRTTGAIFLDWNPADFNSWVYDVADDPQNIKIHSTYKDNIYNLSEAQVKYIEDFEKLPDDFLWRVYGLGLRGAAKELIYTNWKLYNEEPEGNIIYGLDFGFTNPTAMVRVTINDKAVYAEEMIYQSNLTTPELVNRLKQLNIGRSVIYADAAQPEMIESLYRAGFNIHKAEKDVWAGIVSVKSKELYLHSYSKNLITEIQGYKWKKDKNDNVLEEPVKQNDHLADAMRYAIFTDQMKLKMNFADASY